MLKFELSKAPYATLTLFVLLHDPKGFNMNANHLETCFSNLDTMEYINFKYTFP